MARGGVVALPVQRGFGDQLEDMQNEYVDDRLGPATGPSPQDTEADPAEVARTIAKYKQGPHQELLLMSRKGNRMRQGILKTIAKNPAGSLFSGDSPDDLPSDTNWDLGNKFTWEAFEAVEGGDFSRGAKAAQLAQEHFKKDAAALDDFRSEMQEGAAATLATTMEFTRDAAFILATLLAVTVSAGTAAPFIHGGMGAMKESANQLGKHAAAAFDDDVSGPGALEMGADIGWAGARDTATGYIGGKAGSLGATGAGKALLAGEGGQQAAKVLVGGTAKALSNKAANAGRSATSSAVDEAFDEVGTRTTAAPAPTGADPVPEEPRHLNEPLP